MNMTGILIYYNTFLFHFQQKDEKNQMMTTNVWVKQVRHAEKQSNLKLNPIQKSIVHKHD